MQTWIPLDNNTFLGSCISADQGMKACIAVHYGLEQLFPKSQIVLRRRMTEIIWIVSKVASEKQNLCKVLSPFLNL
jgi:hypothetical protein